MDLSISDILEEQNFQEYLEGVENNAGMKVFDSIQSKIDHMMSTKYIVEKQKIINHISYEMKKSHFIDGGRKLSAHLG